MKSLLAVALLCFLLNNVEASTKEALCGGRSYFCPLSSISIMSVVYIHDLYILYFCLQHAKQLLMKFSIKSRQLTPRRPLTSGDEKREQFVMQEARLTSLNSQRISGTTLVVYSIIKEIRWLGTTSKYIALYMCSMNVMLALMLLTLTCIGGVES